MVRLRMRSFCYFGRFHHDNSHEFLFRFYRTPAEQRVKLIEANLFITEPSDIIGATGNTLELPIHKLQKTYHRLVAFEPF